MSIFSRSAARKPESKTPATTAADSTKPKAAAAYRRPSIAGWLAPLLLGPWPAIFAAVTAYAYLGPAIPYVPRSVVLGAGVLFGMLAGSVYIALVALVDVALLALRVRTLPTGMRGWASMLMSPLGFLGAYAVLRPWTYWKGGPWAVALALLVPLVVAAVSNRVLFGARIQKS